MYEFLRVIAALLLSLAFMCVVGFLTGEIQKEALSEVGFVGGLGALILGIIFLVLADLGSRLVRIETKLERIPKDELSDEVRLPSESHDA